MKLIKGDNLIKIKEISDNTIDLTVTSPPYDNLRTYNNQKVFTFEDFEILATELFRVTKTGGVVVWVVGDATINGSETGTSFKQALYFKECGFNLHDTMIYQKLNPQPMNHKKYNASFEYMFIFSVGIPSTFNPIMVPCIFTGKKLSGTKYKQDGNLVQKWGNGKLSKNIKIKSNIFTYPVGSGGEKTEHPAIFPEQLAHDHIKSWSNEGDIILDPFMGSGTTGLVCKKLNREFIGIELDPKYFNIAENRIKKAVRQDELFTDQELNTPVNKQIFFKVGIKLYIGRDD